MTTTTKTIIGNKEYELIEEKELSEIHDCEKCHGKIVAIEIDNVGNEYCGYCHERVHYSRYMRLNIREMKQ